MSCQVLELVYHYQGQNVKYYFVYSTPPSNGSLHFVGRIILSYLGRFPLTEGLSCMSSHLQSENLKYESLNPILLSFNLWPVKGETISLLSFTMWSWHQVGSWEIKWGWHDSKAVEGKHTLLYLTLISIVRVTILTFGFISFIKWGWHAFKAVEGKHTLL